MAYSQQCFSDLIPKEQQAAIAQAFAAINGTDISINCLDTSTAANWAIYNALLEMAAGQVAGVTDGVDAAAGDVGQVISVAIPLSGATITLTTATPANILTIPLTPGDWLVSAIANFAFASATNTGIAAGLSSASAILPVDGSEGNSGVRFTTTTFLDSITLNQKHFNVSVNTNVYVVASATFSAGAVDGYGYALAHRIR
jgi:hypothetical protein